MTHYYFSLKPAAVVFWTRFCSQYLAVNL